jgi:hypothetical protein
VLHVVSGSPSFFLFCHLLFVSVPLSPSPTPTAQAINALCNLAQSDCVRPHLRRHGVHELCASQSMAAVTALDNDVRHIAGLLHSCLTEHTPGESSSLLIK